MEKVLEKIARQLNAFDEASLMSLWDEYQERVEKFEPSQRWEEAVLVFCLLQSVRLKNQLFNTRWSELQEEETPAGTPATASPARVRQRLRPAPRPGVKHRGKVLRFRTTKDDESL